MKRYIIRCLTYHCKTRSDKYKRICQRINVAVAVHVVDVVDDEIRKRQAKKKCWRMGWRINGIHELGSVICCMGIGLKPIDAFQVFWHDRGSWWMVARDQLIAMILLLSLLSLGKVAFMQKKHRVAHAAATPFCTRARLVSSFSFHSFYTWSLQSNVSSSSLFLTTIVHGACQRSRRCHAQVCLHYLYQGKLVPNSLVTPFGNAS